MFMNVLERMQKDIYENGPRVGFLSLKWKQKMLETLKETHVLSVFQHFLLLLGYFRFPKSAVFQFSGIFVYQFNLWWVETMFRGIQIKKQYKIIPSSLLHLIMDDPTSPAHALLISFKSRVFQIYPMTLLPQLSEAENSKGS